MADRLVLGEIELQRARLEEQREGHHTIGVRSATIALATHNKIAFCEEEDFVSGLCRAKPAISSREDIPVGSAERISNRSGAMSAEIDGRRSDFRQQTLCPADQRRSAGRRCERWRTRLSAGEKRLDASRLVVNDVGI